MKIALLAVDSSYPNLALMKLARYHKQRGDSVDWYNPFDSYDLLYMSKIFSFTDDYLQVITNAKNIIKGGTGYSLTYNLPDEIDHLQPDYSIYPQIDNKTAYGFLTRGCVRKCPWCVVPRKEGGIAPYMDVEEIAVEGRNRLILMDNNILASDYGLSQIEKIVRLGLRVDFNQALDARLVTPEVAKLLAQVKWIKRIRFGCDTTKQIQECERAINLIRRSGYNGEFFLYCILIDLRESYERVSHWRANDKVIPFAQPFRDIDNPHKQIPLWQLDMARWVNRRQLFKTCEFQDFSPRKGFTCNTYLNK